ncbi:selenocysteine-specific translation elongation factor [candidate division WOR-3 bacterium]|nr:selenocysteine-specific translation elongation factor [candidate division WOR-3 bacterium]
MHFVVGTAGHIDHGKSALVKALTGTDPDRLKEEQERGMTTDLGFAFLGDDITIIDVPGHEKFVRHMLAGASTIDLVMLVVAADDGVMPQTREHFEICRLLGIKKGLVVLNKIDLVDEDWLEMVRLDVAELVRGSFLEGAPVVAVSARTGAGIEELKKVLYQVTKTVEPKPDRGVFRLPIDRCFTIKGFGTVVAGTVLSGTCRVGDRLELLPQGIEVRVRGIQRHNKPVEYTVVGERAALNLQGVEVDMIVRGNILSTPGYYRPTTVFNGSFYLLKDAGKPLRNMTRVHLHIGTAEVMCRVCLLDKKELQPGEECLVQIRTESRVVCDWNDHYVIRHYSPQQTIGGGVVLEAQGKKVRRFDDETLSRLQELKSGKRGAVLEQFLIKSGFDVKTIGAISRELALTESDAQRMADFLVKDGKARWVEWEGKNYLILERVIADGLEKIKEVLREYHQVNPLRVGMKRAEARVKLAQAPALFETLVRMLKEQGVVSEEGDRLRLATHQVKLNPQEQAIFERVVQALKQAKWQPPDTDEVFAGIEKKLADRVKTALLETGEIVDIGEGVLLHSEMVAEAEKILKELFIRKSELTASEFRQALGTTRKVAIPLLNYFDRTGLTQRRGDIRVLRQNKEPK